MTRCVPHLAVLLLAAGCISTEKAYPVKRQYVLDVTRVGPNPAKPVAGAARIRRLSMSSRFEGTELVYRTGDVTYESDFYNEFLTSPAAMLTEEIRQWLGASGVFASVVDAGSGVGAAYVLEANVPRLYGDYRRADAPQAVLEIEFFLIDDRKAEGAVAFHKTYTAAEPLPSRTAADLVKGLDACLGKALSALEKDLRAALR